MTGIYLSYPFCAQKCTYCNFASGVFPRALEEKYGLALLAEIRTASLEDGVDTVYFGGGTPSTMPLELLDETLRAIPGRAWREATLETAPGTVTRERAVGWVSSGINRVSLGVQSFAQEELARTGRKHTASVVQSEIALLRECGLVNFNVDLIAGLPGQTDASWRESLDWVERLAPPHVSIYMLEVDEDSRLGAEILLGGKRYGAFDTPSDDACAGFYETAVDRLAAMGIPRYEISNFARPGFESIHNLKYWRLTPYAGFGADAHSFDGARRWQNVESADEYAARWERSESVRAECSDSNPGEEKFFVGLRLSAGVITSAEDRAHYAEPIQRFVESGLLERDGARIRLTNKGVLLSNEVFQDFLNV